MARGRTIVNWYGKEVLADIAKMTVAEEYEASQRIFKDAKRKVPVGNVVRTSGSKEWMRRISGTLRASIKLIKGKYGGRLVWVGDMLAVYYAHFVEFGTVFTKKRRGERFLRRSIDAERRKFLNAIKRNLEG